MLQRKKLPRDCAAFTMIEVALAATVLLFAIVSAFQIVAAGTRMLDFSRKQTIATQIIHSEIDKVHLTDWSTVSGYPSSATISINSSLAQVASDFTCTRTVTSIKGDGTLYKIVFTVTWTAKVWSEKNGAGHTYSRQGTTYVGKNGLSATYQRSS